MAGFEENRASARWCALYVALTRACLTPLNRKQQQQEALQAKLDAYQKGETSRSTNLANDFERAYAQAKEKDLNRKQ